jgi:hypothetical protein
MGISKWDVLSYPSKEGAVPQLPATVRIQEDEFLAEDQKDQYQSLRM